MVTVGLDLSPVFSRWTETKTGLRLFGFFLLDRDPDTSSVNEHWSCPILDMVNFLFVALNLGISLQELHTRDGNSPSEFFKVIVGDDKP